MKIEAASSEDFDEIADLWFRSWMTTDPKEPQTASVDTLKKRLTAECWDIMKVCQDERIVAFLAVDPGLQVLSQLFVDPAYQREGIGSRMLIDVMKRFPGGFTLRTDEGNSGARRFYERHDMDLTRIEDGRAYYRWPR